MKIFYQKYEDLRPKSRPKKVERVYKDKDEK